MTHGDLIPGNVLVADARLAGVIDVGGLGPADPALDPVAAWRGGWLYVLRDADRAGRAVVTLLVDDLDEQLAAAAAAGIELGPVETVAGSVRTTWITDPDGNRVQFGQPG